MKEAVNESKKRVDLYDWLRLIATIFVVIGHSAYLVVQSTYGIINYELPANVDSTYTLLSSILHPIILFISNIHMQLFFMLSGAVLALKALDSFDNICTAKIKRLIIPYIFYGCLFMIPVKLFAGFYTNENLKYVFSAFLAGTEGSHLWFLPALFWCIIVFVILVKSLKKYNIDSVYILLLITGFFQLTYDQLPFDVFFLKSGLSYIFWFTLGYVFEKERRKRKPWGLKKIILILLFLLILQILNIKYWFLNSFSLIISASFFTYLLANLCSKVFLRFTKSKIWKVLNQNLFNVYLFYDPLQYIVLKVFMDNYYLTSAFGCYIYTFFRIIGVFVISIFLGEIINFAKRKLLSLENKK